LASSDHLMNLHCLYDKLYSIFSIAILSACCIPCVIPQNLLVVKMFSLT